MRWIWLPICVKCGFLFVIIVECGGSLWPCIAAHSLINSLSVFVNEEAIDPITHIVFTAIMTAAVVLYTLMLLKTLPKTT